MPVDIPGVVADRSNEILARPETDPWAACVAIWARLYSLASPACARYPRIGAVVRDAFSLSVQRAVGSNDISCPKSTLEAMESFDIEDDGSAEWNYMVDLIGIMTSVLDGAGIQICLESSIRFYLEGVFAARSRALAASEGGVVSYAYARQVIADDAEWTRAVDFLGALLSIFGFLCLMVLCGTKQGRIREAVVGDGND